MALKTFSFTITTGLTEINTDGVLNKKYAPLQNLITSTGLGPMDLDIEAADIDINSVEIDIETSYDDSVNLIINDKNNPIKLINSGFTPKSETTCTITKSEGVSTNTYSEENFTTETSLIKTTSTVSTLDFLGLVDGGKLPVGNYTFYFKLADADGNESDFISESGKVICHIGGINAPKSIRGGLSDENSEKGVSFRLNNIDLSYTYIMTYFTRATSSHTGEEKVVANKVISKILITGESTEFTITGYEEIEDADISDINEKRSFFDSVKSVESVQNMTFAANINNNFDYYNELKDLSLRIVPQLCNPENIGNLDEEYNDSVDSDISGGGFEYYNAKNIYYKLGYWNNEIYRFGIVYILNNGTLSPVFPIRGVKSLSSSLSQIEASGGSYVSVDTDNYIIDSTAIDTTTFNSKGVCRIDDTGLGVFGDSIKPIGIKFNFLDNCLEGWPVISRKGIKDYTKGFFIVRQKRIPSIIGQGLSIPTSSKVGIPLLRAKETNQYNNLYYDSFLTSNQYLGRTSNMLANEYYSSESNANLAIASYSNNNALIVPDATLKEYIYNNLFNTSEYKLVPNKYNYQNNYLTWISDKHFSSLNLSEQTLASTSGKLTLVKAGIELITDGTNNFRAKAGSENDASKFLDLTYGNWWENPSTDNASAYQNSPAKVRGVYNTFVGASTALTNNKLYNIYPKDYNFSLYYKEYFKVRFNDASPFEAISDRCSWENISSAAVGDITVSCTVPVYRGDCYISTYTQRISSGFIDPELPTNNKIVDKQTWLKNYRVKTYTTVINDTTGVAVDIDGDPSGGAVDEVTYSGTSYTYVKELQAFTYKLKDIDSVTDLADNNSLAVAKILTPTAKKYKHYSEINGIFGLDKISRPDVNAVQKGQWVTFKVCSNINLAMRDVDFSNPNEEALHKLKRSFYPLQPIDTSYRLPESNTLNTAISTSLSNKYYYDIPDIPYIKTTFTNRIYYSNIHQNLAFKNATRIFLSSDYQDYSLKYGTIIKLVEWLGSLIVVFEHGIAMIPVNERALAANAADNNVYINTDNVLPKNPLVLSTMFGSTWEDSVIKTNDFIYGIDASAKKIWRIDKQKSFVILSDLKVQQFLNANINIDEYIKAPVLNNKFIKTHFNAYKKDVIFTFKNGDYEWALCWNELLNKWICRYSWIPEFSENINNIFYTFARSKSEGVTGLYKLWKHNKSGDTSSTKVLSTNWYNNTEPFEFEFVINGEQGIQKIFDNLEIISNNVPPDSIIFELSGDGYDWSENKQIILDINNSHNNEVLQIGFGAQFPLSF